MAPYSSGVPAVPAAGTSYKAPGPYPATVSAEPPAQALGPYPVAQPTPHPSPASISGASSAEGAPVADAGNHPAAAAIDFFGAPPADAVGAPHAAAVVRPAAMTPTISKDGAFLDGSVHCITAVDRSAQFGTDRAGQVVAAASAVLSQLPDRRLSVRDARCNTGPVSYFTQHLTVIVRALCDVLRSIQAPTSERALWSTPSDYADDLANQAANLNRARDGGDGDGGVRDRRGGGGSDGRNRRRGGSGRNHHDGFGHSSGGGGNGRHMGSIFRGKGGGGHSRSFGGKSSHENSGRGAGSYASGPTSDSSAGEGVGSPSSDVKVVQPLMRQVPSLKDVASSTERLKKMTISAESAQPLSSALARKRQDAVDEAAARAEAEHIDAVKYKYVNIDTRKMARIAHKPQPGSRRTTTAALGQGSPNRHPHDLPFALR